MSLESSAQITHITRGELALASISAILLGSGIVFPPLAIAGLISGGIGALHVHLRERPRTIKTAATHHVNQSLDEQVINLFSETGVVRYHPRGDVLRDHKQDY